VNRVPDILISAATAIRDQRYRDAIVVFAAGSLVRGEGTAYSDLDLIVIYPRVSSAYREAFRFQNLPVEAFVHDPETLHYFFLELDRRSGIPSLPQMVVEGIEIPEPNDISRSLKALAASVIAMGPPALSFEDRQKIRYRITDVLDDLRAPRSAGERIATGAQLFEVLADYYFRTNGLWSAKGKTIPRALMRVNAGLCERYCRSFENLFATGGVDAVIAVAEDMLQPDGGMLFEGFRLDAPPEWRTQA
jgi:predicted nucleotidyltransferase